MSEPTPLYFDDFHVGRRFTSRGITLTEAGIIDFAYKYDPQPFHIDKTAADDSQFGGLIASGFHTLAAAFRMIIQENIFTACSMGSPGLDALRWRQPVYPGDTLKVTMEVTDAAPSSSRPDRGRIRAAYTVTNQHGDAVLTFTAMQIMKRHPDLAGTAGT